MERAFDLVDHSHLLVVLQKYGFGERFLKWIQVLNENQESCVVNGDITTQLFSLDRGTGQGDPISAFLFILALEVSFVLIKTNNKTKGLDTYGHNLLCTACTDDSSFFFKNLLQRPSKILDEFPFFSGLNANKKKCEVAGISVDKGVNVALCGMKNINPIRKMPEFYRETLLNWGKFLFYNPSVISTILSQYLWFNKHIKTGNNSVYFSHFSNHDIKLVAW